MTLPLTFADDDERFLRRFECLHCFPHGLWVSERERGRGAGGNIPDDEGRGGGIRYIKNFTEISLQLLLLAEIDV